MRKQMAVVLGVYFSLVMLLFALGYVSASKGAEEDFSTEWSNLKLFSGPHEHQPEQWADILVIGTPDRKLSVLFSGNLWWSFSECFRNLSVHGTEYYLNTLAPAGVPLKQMRCLFVPLGSDLNTPLAGVGV